MNNRCKGFNKRLFMNRIFNKFKDRWYLFAFIMILAVAVSLLLTLIMVINASVLDNKYYEATSKIYVDWDDNFDFVTSELEANINPEEFNRTYTEKYQDYVQSLIQQWQKKKVADIMTDCNDFLKSNQFRTSINEQLVNEKYNGINGDDVINLSSTGTSHLFTVTVVGFGNQNRVAYLAELTVESILNTGQEIFGLENANVVDEVDAYRVVKTTTSTGRVDYTRYEDYPDKSVQNDNNINVIETIFSYRNLKIIVFSALFGIVFISLLGVLDSKISNELQVSEIVEADYIGKLVANKEDTYSILGATISARAKNTRIEDIVLLSPSKEVSPYAMTKLMDNVDKTFMSIASVTAITDNTDSILRASDTQGIILVVSAKYDTFKQLKETLTKIDIIKGNIIGYIFCEVPYFRNIENKKLKVKKQKEIKHKNAKSGKAQLDNNDEIDLL